MSPLNCRICQRPQAASTACDCVAGGQGRTAEDLHDDGVRTCWMILIVVIALFCFSGCAATPEARLRRSWSGL